MPIPPPGRRPTRSPARVLLGRGTLDELRRVAAVLRTETVGGLLLLACALLALAWANSPWHAAYENLRDLQVGPSALHLDLSLQAWAADGLLAIFFFVVGLELKQEFRHGDLRDPRQAALPVAASACGVLVPALVYLGMVALRGSPSGALSGWAIPTATDIAFALAVLAVVGTHLPSALRSFLLTLAVVDDLIAITIIALVYTAHIDVRSLLLSLLGVALFGLVARVRHRWLWLLLPLAGAAWALMHASGVHATIAGVLLGLVTPARVREGKRVRRDDHGVDEHPTLVQRWEHLLRPVSAGVAVPAFAFFSSGVRVVGTDLGAVLTDPVVDAVVVGLVLGKLTGVLGGTWAFSRFTRADLDPSLGWWDVLGVSLLAGIGFTVSLLVTELAFAASDPHHETAKLGVLLATLTSALLAAALLRRRNAHYRELEQQEQADEDHDGVPDVFQREPAAGT